jgi:hypothetical protein
MNGTKCYLCSVPRNVSKMAYMCVRKGRKVKLPLSLTKYHNMKTHSVLNLALCHEEVIGGVAVWLHVFLTSALGRGGRSTSRSGRLPPVPIGWLAGWAPKLV